MLISKRQSPFSEKGPKRGLERGKKTMTIREKSYVAEPVFRGVVFCSKGREKLCVKREKLFDKRQFIPGIVNIQAGENLNSSNNQGYTYGFTIQFTDTEVFKGYAPHPAHQPVSEELQRICESIIDFDLTEPS
jgi:Stress responsive A/B Barrel Domain